VDKIRIKGGRTLKGTVAISGAKNAALPLMAASLLTAESLELFNLPHLSDISTMAQLLVQHGVVFSMRSLADGDSSGRVVRLQAADIHNLEAPYDIVRKMRASVLVLGPLLARFGSARVSLPGGCAIGTRPIDRHLKALEQMGATIDITEGYIEASVRGRLKGAEIIFEAVSVGATENILMAATLAEGTTKIMNAAREPEVQDLALCLLKMGAKIEGIGTDCLIVEGVEALSGASHSVIFDRIEAGTYLAAVATAGGEVLLQGVEASYMTAFLEKFQEAGVSIKPKDSGILIKATPGCLKSVDASTQVYPGFPTDMQAQLMAAMIFADGTSAISETIFENRFMHVPELCRMGAHISVSGHTALVRGVKSLRGAEVMATDLRASVSLIIAALAAEGDSIIHRIYHIDRGYEAIEEKLAGCGAAIERIT
jgi:UDP-N-acetylglucosamine 1-carboxyvinyltransferase